MFVTTPGLLVSVRSALESLEALAGGADVIDVKDPENGSLGAASAETIASVVAAVGGSAPVTAALGELRDSDGSAAFRPVPGVTLYKLGLAGADGSSWRDALLEWRDAALSLKAKTRDAKDAQ